MIKKFIASNVMAGLFRLAWHYVSQSYQNRKLPGEADIRLYHDRMIRNQHIAVDRAVVEELFLKANGGRLHLSIASVGPQAPTLVMIPGTAAYAQFMYDTYQQGFNVIGFDPRGHGQSSGPRGNYAWSGIVDYALAVVNYARGRFGGKVAPAGNSQGGMAAFYAAAMDDGIAVAVLHNIADLNGRDNTVHSTIRPPRFLIPICRLLMNIYAKYSFPIALYLDLKKEKLNEVTTATDFIKADLLGVSWITFRAFNSLMKTDLAKPVEKITVPIMLIHAGKDNIFPQSYVEGIYNHLTCRKNYLLPKDREHLVMTNNVDDVVPPVSAWLKEIMV